MNLLERLFFHHHPAAMSTSQVSTIQTSKKKTPGAILYYDKDKKLTIVILSDRSGGYLTYLTSRQARGSCFEISPLYYELEGFVRENLVSLQQYGVGIVSVALGALEASDAEQLRQMLQAEEHKLSHRPVMYEEDEKLFQEAIKIASLHRLGDDLDVLSLMMMRIACKSMGRVAAKLLQERLRQTTLTVIPYVDGIYLSGYSAFVRQDSSRRQRCFEDGRAVEYQQRPSVQMHYDCELSEWVPDIDSDEDSTFEWKCEEIALGNLHRWWGDIAATDYVGQKVQILWNPLEVDSMLLSKDQISNAASGVTLSWLRLESMPPLGLRRWRMSLASISLLVQESCITDIDDVTTEYKGSVRIKSALVDIRTLGRAAARASAKEIQKEHDLIQQTRPLLPREHAFCLSSTI